MQTLGVLVVYLLIDIPFSKKHLSPPICLLLLPAVGSHARPCLTWAAMWAPHRSVGVVGATAFEMTCGWSVYNQNVNMKIGKRIDIHKAGGDENQRQRGRRVGKFQGTAGCRLPFLFPRWFIANISLRGNKQMPSLSDVREQQTGVWSFGGVLSARVLHHTSQSWGSVSLSSLLFSKAGPVRQCTFVHVNLHLFRTNRNGFRTTAVNREATVAGIRTATSVKQVHSMKSTSNRMFSGWAGPASDTELCKHGFSLLSFNRLAGDEKHKEGFLFFVPVRMHVVLSRAL